MNTDSPAKRLRAWRVKNHVTQTALAAQVGCKPSEISHYEKGRTPASERAIKLNEITDAQFPVYKP